MTNFERAKNFIDFAIDFSENFLTKCDYDRRYFQGQLEAFKIVKTHLERIERDDDTMPNDN